MTTQSVFELRGMKFVRENQSVMAAVRKTISRAVDWYEKSRTETFKYLHIPEDIKESIEAHVRLGRYINTGKVSA